MSKRGDNIHKRKDGRWEGRYISNRGVDGKAIYSSVYGKSFGEVKEKLIFAQQQNIEKTINCNIKLADVIDEWISTIKIKCKPSTYLKYSNIINSHIKPEIGNAALNEMTPNLINDFISKKLNSGRLDDKKSLSPAYVSTMILIINSALKYYYGPVIFNEFKGQIAKPKIAKKPVKLLDNEDYHKLVDCLFFETDLTKFAIMISLFTGLRIGELCALKWENIDFKKSTINVTSTISRIKKDNKKTALIIENPKTIASNRCIPIPSFLMDKMHIFYTNIDNFVISNTPYFINPRTLEYRFHKTLKNANIKDINFHALRHTFASKCIEVGMDVKSLSEILGHANASVTLNIYVHSSMDIKRANMERLTA